MKTIFKLIYLFLLFFVESTISKASHLVVGEMIYRNTGTNKYECTIFYYRDCRPVSQGGGNPNAIADDDPVYVTVFRNNTFYSVDSIFSSESFTLPVTNTNACLSGSNQACVNRIKFVFTLNLPDGASTYTILTQRCCLNASICNIFNPGNNGYSFYCTIPPTTSGANSSAVFKTVADVLLCANKKYSIDHSAFDIDNDSLSYELCQADLGGDPTDPKPKITGGSLPTFQAASYLPPYTSSNPMAGLTLNSSTGELIINANLQGAFLVTVCCHEWRNGSIINTIKRSYTYTVQNCDFSVQPIIACDSNIVQASNGQTCLANCSGKTIAFKNKSKGALSYHWDFGVSSLSDDTSNVFEPSYTYPDTGRYKVTLIAYGATCTDSIIEYVNISLDELSADFNFAGNLCIGDSIQFSGSASSSNDIISYWKWDFINDNVYLKSFQQNPLLNFQVAGNYHVILNAFDSHGCYAAKEKDVQLTSIDVVAYSDTIVPVGTTIQLNASGAQNYFWNYQWIETGNSGFLSNLQNPVVAETLTGEVIYIVTGTQSDACIGRDTIHVFYTGEQAVFVPNAFSPNGDHLNDEVKIFLSGYSLVYFKIYNRRGQEVFHTRDKNIGWDGSFHGGKLGLDSYYWLACVRDANAKEQIFKGDIILVR